ncbi:hypothetical protein [Micromonospora sp. NPDC049679]|uniref:hypothetical protein n=1 Tax=Micromonospora sp. NPDC049679 TaxID=3155920 RepID=UPI0033F3D84B
MNAHRLAFTTFIGDIKNGKERCDQRIYDAAVGNFNSFNDPWSTFPATTSGPTVTGRVTAITTPASDSLPSAPRSPARRDRSAVGASPSSQSGYPENVRWQHGPVTYVGLNIPGSGNNAPPVQRERQADRR